MSVNLVDTVGTGSRKDHNDTALTENDQECGAVNTSGPRGFSFVQLQGA
ncbi:hypothetical protein [Desulfovibrio inopinatus]|nr:hypothetical protein [Desulfovibrio inopinatus]